MDGARQSEGGEGVDKELRSRCASLDSRDRISAFVLFLSGRDCPAAFGTELNMKDSYWPLPRGRTTTQASY